MQAGTNLEIYVYVIITVTTQQYPIFKTESSYTYIKETYFSRQAAIIRPIITPINWPDDGRLSAETRCLNLFIFIPRIILITLKFRLVHLHLKYFDIYSPCFNTTLFKPLQSSSEMYLTNTG
jgi:hypothetical protein